MSDDTQALVQEFRLNLRQLDQQQRRLQKSMDRTMNAVQKSAHTALMGTEARFRQFSDKAGASLAALAAGAGLAKGVSILADFGQAMSTVAAITKATGSDLAALEAQARLLGSTTRFSATQAAEGMLYLARAGFDTQQVLGAIEGTLQLAQAGALDLGRAADIASNVLTGFRMDVSETGRVVDVLALAANSANTDVDQLGQAMKYVGAVASGLGISLEESTAAVAALSNAGLQADMAGTGLRKVLTRLEAPNKALKDQLEAVGLTVEDVKPSVHGLANVLEVLKEKGFGVEEAMLAFGDRGGPAFEVLASAVPQIRDLNVRLDDAAGTAKRVSKVMDENLNGALLATRSRLEELVLAMGEAGAEDALIAALEGLQALLTLMAENADVLQIALIALAARAIVPLAMSLGKDVVIAARAAQAQLIVLNGLAGRTTTAMQVMSIAARGLWASLGPITLAVAALSTAYIMMARNSKTAEESLQEAQGAARNFQSEQKNLADLTKELEDRQKDLTAAIEAQETAIANTAALDIDTLNERIRKSKELLALYRDQARLKLDDAQRALDKMETPDLLKSGRGAKADKRGRRDIVPMTAEARDDVLAGIRAKIEAGERLTGQEREALEIETERARINAEIVSLKKSLADMGVASVPAAGSVDPGDDDDDAPGGSVSAEIDDAVKRQREALEELDAAHKELTQSERDQVRELLDERLAAIDAQLKAEEISEERARELRAKAKSVALSDLSEIDAAEQALAAEKAARKQDELDREQQFAADVLASRDWVLGRTISLFNREYDAREKKIRDEIQSEGLKNEALAALAEERAAEEARLRDELLGAGEFSEDPAERIRAEQEIALQALRDALENELITREEFLARRNALEMQADAELAESRAQSQLDIMASSRGFFGSLIQLAKKHKGENSAIAKALFIADKAMAAGQVWIQAEIAKFKALATLGPIAGPPAAAAIDITKYISLATIAAQTLTGFKDGVIGLKGPGTGRSDSIGPVALSKGESVITERGTSFNESLLQSINRGERVQESIRRMQNLLDSGAIAPGPVGGAIAGPSVYVGALGGPVTLQVQGNVTPEAVPSIEAALKSYRDDMLREAAAMIAAQIHTDTPRHKRKTPYRG